MLKEKHCDYFIQQILAIKREKIINWIMFSFLGQSIFSKIMLWHFLNAEELEKSEDKDVDQKFLVHCRKV